MTKLPHAFVNLCLFIAFYVILGSINVATSDKYLSVTLL